ncbi:MAG: hypothetical protein GF315_02765 [candidate division Zixibacteria bacterium]|nr:hypothetical protein [candidate division Zixibacteria bacterium]
MKTHRILTSILIIITVKLCCLVITYPTLMAAEETIIYEEERQSQKLEDVFNRDLTIIELSIENGHVEMLTEDREWIEFDLSPKGVAVPEIPQLEGIIRMERGQIPLTPDKGERKFVWSGDETMIIEESEEVLHDIFVMGSDVIVKGYVGGNIVALDGDILVTSTGRVDGDVSTIGGEVEKEPGAIIKGERIETPGLPGVSAPDIHFPSPVLVFLFVSVIFSMAVISIAPRNVLKVKNAINDKVVKSLLLGYLYVIGIPFVIAILAITVIGIPVIIALPFIVFAALLLGFTAFSSLIGQRFLEWVNIPEKSPLLTVLTGAVLCQILIVFGALIGTLGGFLNGISTMFTVIGIIVLFGIVLPVSFGAAITTVFGTRPKTVVTVRLKQDTSDV